MHITFSDDQYYDAIVSRDKRFNNRFFFGVISTGIYCRPGCSSKTPNRENCRFFSTTKLAELAGYRSCLRCRPEQTRNMNGSYGFSFLVQRLMNYVDNNLLIEYGITLTAKQLKVSKRHLQRIFRGEFGIPLIQFIQIQRLLLAKDLLSTASLSVTEVALMAGFGSIRHFNTLFKAQFQLTPTQFRQIENTKKHASSITFKLNYKSPMDWQLLTQFIRLHAIPSVEQINNDVYYRTVRLFHKNQWYTGWVSVELLPNLSALKVTLDIELVPVILLVLKRISRLFDLACFPQIIEKALRQLPNAQACLRIPGTFDGFELALKAILAQYFSTEAISPIMERFVSHFGQQQSTPFLTLSHTFPDPNKIQAIKVEEIVDLGIPHLCAKTFIELSQVIIKNKLSLSLDDNFSESIEQLRALSGMSEWAVQCIAMHALLWPDALPITDSGSVKILGTDLSECTPSDIDIYRPWRAYVAMYLYSKMKKAIDKSI